MTSAQQERLIVAEEKKAEALVIIGTILQRWYDVVNPVIEPAGEAEVYNVRDPKPQPESKEEYAALPEEGKGRFQALIETYQQAARS